MKKMNKPEIEVLRFRNDDLIVTSGGYLGTPITQYPHNYFVTLGREAKQYYNKYNLPGADSYDDNTPFLVSNLNNLGLLSDVYPLPDSSLPWKSRWFVWFNAAAEPRNEWGTDSNSYSYYIDNGLPFPGGTD